MDKGTRSFVLLVLTRFRKCEMCGGAVRACAGDGGWGMGDDEG